MAKLTALQPINHDGKDYAVGDPLTVSDKVQIEQLLEVGAAEHAGAKTKSAKDADAETAAKAAAEADVAAKAEAQAREKAEADAAAAAAAGGAGNPQV